MPWHFWKWLIPLYNAVLCVSFLLIILFFVSTVNSNEFLLYVSDDNLVIWDLLPTMPCVYLLIEYPFNMIPMEWPMLFFVELLFTIYMLLNFIVVAADKDH